MTEDTGATAQPRWHANADYYTWWLCECSNGRHAARFEKPQEAAVEYVNTLEEEIAGLRAAERTLRRENETLRAYKALADELAAAWRPIQYIDTDSKLGIGWLAKYDALTTETQEAQ